ncbi:MAG TPA: HD domain-containing protein [Gemmatimonadales bacterium]
MTPIELTQLAPGDRVEGALLVLDVEAHTPETGNPFTTLRLGNHTGAVMTEPFWLERNGEIAGIRAGHVVQVLGEITSYRNKRQLAVTSIRALPDGSVDPASLMPSVGAVDPYWETLDRWRRAIAKPRLATVLSLFFDDDAFRAEFERCPAAVAGHHAALGGLLKHTTEVAAIARTIGRTSGADLELVLAGALLHDIGKLDAYRWDGLFAHTEPGRLLGHVVLGVQRLDRRLAREPVPACTPRERDILLHLVLSHHGRREWGSPVPPMTLEAEVLHWADNASAKTASMGDIIADPAGFMGDGLFSEPHWTIDRRRAYRGTSDWGVSG